MVPRMDAATGCRRRHRAMIGKYRAAPQCAGSAANGLRTRESSSSAEKRYCCTNAGPITSSWERPAPGVRWPLVKGNDGVERMTKPLTKTVQPVPDENQSHKGPGSAPDVPVDTTKGHRDDEKQNIREQAAHGNLTQNTSNRRMG